MVEGIYEVELLLSEGKTKYIITIDYQIKTIIRAKMSDINNNIGI